MLPKSDKSNDLSCGGVSSTAIIRLPAEVIFHVLNRFVCRVAALSFSERSVAFWYRRIYENSLFGNFKILFANKLGSSSDLNGAT